MGLKQKLTSGRFVVLVELDPPKGVDTASFVKTAENLADRTDAVLVPDLSDAIMRMSALGGASLLAARGLETVMQITTRDRNRLALQAELLSASALGIANILVDEGSDPSLGDHHQALPVCDIEVDELLACIHGLNNGKDLAGFDLEGRPDLFAGGCLKLWSAGRMEGHLDLLNRMVAAGARYFITPPVFDIESLKASREKYAEPNITLLPTVLMLKSVAMAKALRNHAKQIHMPDGLVSRLKRTRQRVDECLEIAAELIRGVKEAGFGGVVISPKGWEDKIPRLLDSI